MKINKNTNILVTGGSGFIGSAIVEKLCDVCNVTVFDNDFRGKKSRLDKIKSKIYFVKGDIRRLKDLEKAAKNIDVIIHLAYIQGTKNFYKIPYDIIEVATKGIINVLSCMDKFKINNLVLASSSEVYQEAKYIPTNENIELKIPDIHNPRYTYGGGKIISELIAINYTKVRKKNLLIFRPHTVYGPDMGKEHVIPELIEKIRKKIKKDNTINLKIQGSGNETRSFMFIEDFVNGFLKILKKGKKNNIYNIGSDENVSIKYLIKKMEKILKIKINVTPGQLRSGSAKRRCPDISKLLSLGHKNSYKLDEGLKKTIEWYLYNPLN